MTGVVDKAEKVSTLLIGDIHAVTRGFIFLDEPIDAEFRVYAIGGASPIPAPGIPPSAMNANAACQYSRVDPWFLPILDSRFTRAAERAP